MSQLRVRNRPILLILIITVSLVSVTIARAQDPAQPAKPDEKGPPPVAQLPKVVAVEFWADWCQSCKVLMPKFIEAKSTFQKSILFTRFDLTNEFTKEQAAYLAAVAGLEEVYRRGNGKTGMVALVDAKTKKVLAVVNQSKSVEEIRAILQDAIAKSE